VRSQPLAGGRKRKKKGDAVRHATRQERKKILHRERKKGERRDRSLRTHKEKKEKSTNRYPSQERRRRTTRKKKGPSFISPFSTEKKLPLVKK